MLSLSVLQDKDLVFQMLVRTGNKGRRFGFKQEKVLLMILKKMAKEMEILLV